MSFTKYQPFRSSLDVSNGRSVVSNTGFIMVHGHNEGHIVPLAEVKSTALYK